jgi:hypothetical protein
MPLHTLNNWTVCRHPDGRVILTSWERDENNALIKSFLVKPKIESDGKDTKEKTESVGKGVQDKRAVYRRYEFVLPASAIKPTEGTGGWSTSVVVDGKTRITLSLGMKNRAQNPKYPQDIQPPEQINAIIGSVGADAGNNKKEKKKQKLKADEVEANVDSDED